jgi:hypothetical protein
LLRVVRLHHAFFPIRQLAERKRKRKKMKEGSNNSDKISCPRSGDTTHNIHTHYQQLPIKVKLLRLQVQPLIEEGITHYLYGAVHAFQHRLALLRH